MENLTAFVLEHINDDTTRLIMNRAKWPEIDMDLAVNCIESRRKLKGKVQEWHDHPGLIFPRRLSAEQCSSSATGAYKAELASRICENYNLADLTGGLGVDSWFFSQKARNILYCEMLPELCKAARHNFSILEAGNICVKNVAVSVHPQDTEEIFHSPADILSDFHPDIVYMDPARRGEGGRKVFLLEDCMPDVLTLKDEIFKFTRHILIKLSPMADISMVCDRLGSRCREVHVVAAAGECKELLVWMDREWNKEYTILAVELQKTGPAGIFSFTPSQEKLAHYTKTDAKIDSFLFEPGKSLMKAGAFNLMAERFRVCKLGKSTHYYTFNEESTIGQLIHHGKIFRILDAAPLDKRSIKAFGKDYPKAEVTARNIPMDTDTLRKKLGVSSGDEIHIFGLKSDMQGSLLLATSPVK